MATGTTEIGITGTGTTGIGPAILTLDIGGLAVWDGAWVMASVGAGVGVGAGDGPVTSGPDISAVTGLVSMGAMDWGYGA